MHNGVKTLFAVSVLVLLAYAAMAAWPALQALREAKPQPQQLAVVPPAVSPAVSSLPRATGTSTPMPARSGTAHAATRNPGFGNLSQPTMLTPSWDSKKVRFAAYNVEMHAEPDGNPLRPNSLCKAPLTMLRGTRLLTVRKQDGWVLVTSPSAMLGWVEASALTDKRPFVID